MVDWNDPASRARYIDQVGPDAYGEAQAKRFKDSTVSTVNGYGIRPVQTRFGRLFQVIGTEMAFSTLEESEKYASERVAKV